VDIAVAFDFLLSDRARFITGQVLNVCGGTSVNFLNRDDSQ
jgi:NAD(P)-dependent dehydrogenase (short-subunit alcohol dehydrogenase family)